MTPATEAQVRSCGTCTLCCKLLLISEINKPHGVWCQHGRPGRGCAIYADRPKECRTFRCGYLAAPELPEEWHPAKSKIVLVAEPGGGVTAVVDPGRADAWKQEPFYSRLKAWSADVVQRKQGVLVRIGKRTIAVLPDRDIDLGIMDSGEKVLVEQITGPHGTTYSARRGGAPSTGLAP